MKFRTESDSMGTLKVPADAHWGSQTARAKANFDISGILMPVSLIHALALVKKNAARANRDLGLLEDGKADAIIQAAERVVLGELDTEFVLDVFQTGSGTSTNMNMNEVLASLANERLTGNRGGRDPVHPNDHVNLGQSSNDTIPTALHISAVLALKKDLLPALNGLSASLWEKSEGFKRIHKIGRTHLQDAVPITLGQVFSGYARQVDLGAVRIQSVMDRLSELALGGTAVGTGINTHKDFARKAISLISNETGWIFKEAQNHFEAQAAKDACVEASGALKTLAAGLFKIANDIRFLGSGPRCGIGEIHLPKLQPGSSIMPGKVNPVIPESVMQVCAQVMGNDQAITIGGMSGNFELNVMMPLIAHNLLGSIALLAKGVSAFDRKCVRGIAPEKETCEKNIEKSLAMVTGLVPYIGYDRAAEIANKAYEQGKTVREIVVAEKILSEHDIDNALSP